MRHLVFLALILPFSAQAETVLATSRITAVTLYPQGAQVTREVSFTAPPGAHDLVITDLPAAILPEMIRLASPDATLGAFALRSDRLPPRIPPTSPAQEAAKAAVTAAEATLAQAQGALDAIAAEVEAQQAQIGFLTGLRLDSAGATAEGLTAIAQMIQTRVLAARQAAQAAQLGLPAAQKAVTQAQEALARAEAALEALSRGDEAYAALTVAVSTSGPGGHLTVTHFMEEARWSPVYDIALDRKAPQLTLDRGVLVSQSTGEDWTGVALTLSTAQPASQADASALYPDLRRIADPASATAKAMADDMAGGVAEAMVAPAPMAASRSVAASPAYQGDTVVYHAPAAVDVASGVEDLRLALDQLHFTPKIEARAVPRRDATAFLVARLTNTSPERLLPGTAWLSRDGALVGSTDLPDLAPGADTTLGFGAIEGLRLTRDMPLKAEGDRGIFSTSTQMSEKAVLKVENLTDESWPLHLLDQVPYSEQEDLQISFTADPPASTEDVEGQRGILAWDFTLGPKETREIRLETRMRWPEGKALQ